MLVHGGAHGAWCWEQLLPFLDGDAFAVDLPPKSVRGGARGLDPLPELQTLTVGDFAESVLRDVADAGFDRFALVGHSMGGLTISEVARRVPDRIENLVLSCMVPPEGASAIDALPEDLRAVTREAVEEARRGGDNPIGGLDEQTTRLMFCNDMDEEQTRFVLERTGTEAAAVLAEPVTRADIPPELPKTFVKLLRDQSLPPDHQDVLVQNLRDSPGGDVDVVTIDAGHDVMISRPKELADVLNRIAAAKG